MDEGTPRLLLEGRPGIGKTTVARRLLELLEVGKMELASTVFCEALAELLGRDVAVVATVHLARHRLADALGIRPDVHMVQVTQATRDALAEQLMDCMVGALRGERQ